MHTLTQKAHVLSELLAAQLQLLLVLGPALLLRVYRWHVLSIGRLMQQLQATAALLLSCAPCGCSCYSKGGRGEQQFYRMLCL
jgi:hypothetical protein